MKMQRLGARAVLLAILLGGCATAQPVPEPSQPQSSGIGIEVKLRAPIGIFSNKPDSVYFTEIGTENALLQKQIFRSNYAKDGRVYLLNAPPGTYVAVAAFFFKQGAPRAAPQSPGVTLSAGPLSGGYTTYFSKDIVERTKVTVRESQFAFMGGYVVDQSAGLDGADAVQAHYKDVVAPRATTNTILMGLSGDIHYRGALNESMNDEQARSQFLNNAKGDLAGSTWAARLK